MSTSTTTAVFVRIDCHTDPEVIFGETRTVTEIEIETATATAKENGTVIEPSLTGTENAGRRTRIRTGRGTETETENGTKIATTTGNRPSFEKSGHPGLLGC